MSSHSQLTFMIVGKDDNPLYEADFGSGQKKEDTHFLVHSALDVVEDAVWTTSSLFLRNIDRLRIVDREWFVSAFVSAGHVKFILLHDTRNEDGIKSFFNDVYELYLKVLLNPFYEPHTPITLPAFDARVRALGKRHL